MGDAGQDVAPQGVGAQGQGETGARQALTDHGVGVTAEVKSMNLALP